MANLNTLATTKLATKTNVDMKTAGTTILYSVPIGKNAIITAVVIRNISASLAGGTDYDFTSWRQNIDLSGMTSTSDYRILIAEDNTSYALLTEGTNFQITVSTGSIASATATIDVFGYLV